VVQKKLMRFNSNVCSKITRFSPKCSEKISLVIKDLVYEAKSKTKTFLKAKDIKIIQGQLRQLPLRAKICIAVTETEYAYLIKHNAGRPHQVNDKVNHKMSLSRVT